MRLICKEMYLKSCNETDCLCVGIYKKSYELLMRTVADGNKLLSVCCCLVLKVVIMMHLSLLLAG